MMEQPESTPTGEVSRLDLFPLNSVVLFPGMPLPLHIFEERYKAMIGDCLAQNKPFGVLLIKEGREVGDPAEPHRIGATARILRDERLDEGRMNILAVGERRFEVLDIPQYVPHLIGQVRYLDELPGEPSPELLTQIKEQYGEYLQGLTSLAGGYTTHSNAPDDPVRLAYAVATSVDFPPDIRQQVLELPTAQLRLERLVSLLQRANELLKEEIARRNPFRGPRLN